MHRSIMPPLSAAKEEALQIMLRRGEIEERRQVRQRRSDSLSLYQPKPAACVKCGDMLNLSALIRCKSIACSASCCRAVGATCKHHCVASGEVGQQQGPPTCVNCGVSVKDNTAKRCANNVCKAACCRTIGKECKHHRVSGEKDEEARTCVTCSTPLRDTTAKRCSNHACTAACCNKVGAAEVCKHHDKRWGGADFHSASRLANSRQGRRWKQ